MSIEVTSPAFDDRQAIPKKHTEDGEDVSPELKWAGAPPGTVEYALIVDDPDAPVKDPWVHWVLYKIPGNWTSLPSGFHGAKRPEGVSGVLQGPNSWKTTGYRGPAPPKGHGRHHYHFKLYALDTALVLPTNLDKTRLLAAIKGHIKAQGELVGTYER